MLLHKHQERDMVEHPSCCCFCPYMKQNICSLSAAITATGYRIVCCGLKATQIDPTAVSKSKILPKKNKIQPLSSSSLTSCLSVWEDGEAEVGGRRCSHWAGDSVKSKPAVTKCVILGKLLWIHLNAHSTPTGRLIHSQRRSWAQSITCCLEWMAADSSAEAAIIKEEWGERRTGREGGINEGVAGV